MPRPTAADAGFGQHYIALAQGDSAKEIIAKHAVDILQFYTNLPHDKKDFAYAEGKWTIIEVLQHVIDAERVFSYRAMRFARKDTTPLPGFEENDYAANSQASSRDFDEVKEEFAALRKATDIFATTLSEEQLQSGGQSNNRYITANGLVFIIYGHLLHHMNIIKERYLPA